MNRMDNMTHRRADALIYEHMLVSRHALQDTARHDRDAPLDRSATVLLARLDAQEPMTVAELADAFDLDVSTVHRQVAAAIKHGLVERLDDPDGGQARKHRPSPEGKRRLAAEFEGRRKTAENVMKGWSDEDLETYVRLLRRFNEGVEKIRGKPWPRPQDSSGAK